MFNRFYFIIIVFFFQAEDGIRDWSVTGVQTCGSSDLVQVEVVEPPQGTRRVRESLGLPPRACPDGAGALAAAQRLLPEQPSGRRSPDPRPAPRSEERRVGKECRLRV